MRRTWIILPVIGALVVCLVLYAMSQRDKVDVQASQPSQQVSNSIEVRSLHLSKAVDTLAYSHTDDSLWAVAKGRDGDKSRHLLKCDVNNATSIEHFSASQKSPCFGLVLSPDDRFLYSAAWRTGHNRGAEVLELNSHDGSLNRKLQLKIPIASGLRVTSDPVALGISPDGEFIAVGTKLVDDQHFVGGHLGGELSVLNLKTGVVAWSNSTVHTNILRSVVFTPDSKQLISAGEDSLLRIWNIHTGELLTTLVGVLWGGVASMDVSPDGRFLATGGAGREEGGLVRVWDLEKKKLLHVFSPFVRGSFAHVHFRADGELVAAGATTSHDVKPPRFELHAWKGASFARLGAIGNGEGIVGTLTSASSGNKVAVGTWEGEVVQFKSLIHQENHGDVVP